MRRPLLVLVLLAGSTAVVACDGGAAEKEKQCTYALDDAERLLKTQDLARAREAQQKAASGCPPKLEERAATLSRSIDEAEARLKALREQQDQAEREKAAKAASKNHGQPAVIGQHSAETGATGDCKTYVDCLCGLADSYRYKVGVDAHRAVCDDAKKVLAGKNAQEGCRTLLKELAAQDDRWKEPYETQGISVPTMCP